MLPLWYSSKMTTVINLNCYWLVLYVESFNANNLGTTRQRCLKVCHEDKYKCIICQIWKVWINHLLRYYIFHMLVVGEYYKLYGDMFLQLLQIAIPAANISYCECEDIYTHWKSLTLRLYCSHWLNKEWVRALFFLTKVSAN